MSVLSVASGQSAYRGYEYYKKQKVSSMEQAGEGVIKASVAGSNSTFYDVIVDINHPRKSQCSCPHAAGKRIVCKHMVAVYFTARPWEAEKYIADLEAYWEEEEQRQEEQEEKLFMNQQVIRTPVVRNGKEAAVGYAPEVWKKWGK